MRRDRCSSTTATRAVSASPRRRSSPCCPGTGGLTRLVDKRKVRRDRADVFCTTAEGIKGKRAKDWGLVDHVVVAHEVGRGGRRARRRRSRAKQTVTRGPAVAAARARAEGHADETLAYRYVELAIDRARAHRAPRPCAAPTRAEPTRRARADRRRAVGLRAFRELDDALLRLRFDYPEIGMVTVRTTGDAELVRACDEALAKATTGFAREVRLLQRRVLKRYDNTARSFYAVADRADSCFAGVLLELALGADRFYMLIDGDEKIARVDLGREQRLPADVDRPVAPRRALLRRAGARPEGPRARRRGPDSVARRPSSSASRRSPPTTSTSTTSCASPSRSARRCRPTRSPAWRRRSASSGPRRWRPRSSAGSRAWQNWIFTRPNSTGEHGALTLYGQPERPQFEWQRT